MRRSSRSPAARIRLMCAIGRCKSDDPDEEDVQLDDAILAAVDELCARRPGRHARLSPRRARDPRDVREALRKHHPPGAEILPLFARLSADEQMKVFQPHRPPTHRAGDQRRRDVAHGARHPLRHRSRARPDQPVRPADEGAAAADRADQPGQRQPARRSLRPRRAGRLRAAVFSEEDFISRAAVHRAGNPADEPRQRHPADEGAAARRRAGTFPFVEPPDYRAIRDGYQTLHELGAIDERNELTEIGRQLRDLPIDPRIGRMILAGDRENCLDEMLIIASALQRAGSARAADGQAAGRRRPRTVSRRAIGFPRLSQALGFLSRAGRESVEKPDAEDGQDELSFVRPHARMARHAPAAAPGDGGEWADSAQSTCGTAAFGSATEGGGTAASQVRPAPSRAAQRPPRQHRPEDRCPRIHRCAKHEAVHLPGLRPLSRQTPVDRRGGTGRNDAAVCPQRRADSAGMDRAFGGAPGQSQLYRSALAGEDRTGNGV